MSVFGMFRGRTVAPTEVPPSAPVFIPPVGEVERVDLHRSCDECGIDAGEMVVRSLPDHEGFTIRRTCLAHTSEEHRRRAEAVTWA